MLLLTTGPAAHESARMRDEAAASAAAGLSGDAKEGQLHSWLADAVGPLAAVPVHPAARDATLGAPTGLLELELRCAPAPVLRPFLDLLAALTERAAAAGDNAYSPHAAALLWALRCGSLLEAAALQVLADAHHAPLHERAISELPLLLAQLQSSLRVRGAAAVQRWIVAADAAQDVALATALHAHIVLLWAHAQPNESGVTASAAHEWATCGFTQLLTSGMHVVVWQRACTTRLATLGAASAASAGDLPADSTGTGAGSGSQAPPSPFMLASNPPLLLSSAVSVVLGNAPLQAALLSAVRKRDMLSQWLADAETRCIFVTPPGGAPTRATASDVVLTHCARACLPGLFAPTGATATGSASSAGAGGEGAASAIAHFERDADSGRYDTADSGGWSMLFPVAMLANGKAVSTLPSAIASHSDFHSLLERGPAGSGTAAQSQAVAADPVAQSGLSAGSGDAAGAGQQAAGSLAAKIVHVDGEGCWAQVTLRGISYDVMHWTPLHAKSREVPMPAGSDVTVNPPLGWTPAPADAYLSYGLPRWVQRAAGAAAPRHSPDFAVAGRAGQVLSFGGVAYSRLYKPGVGMLGPAGALLDSALHPGQRVYLFGDPAFAAPGPGSDVGASSSLPTPPKDLPTLVALLPDTTDLTASAFSPGESLRLLLWLSPSEHGFPSKAASSPSPSAAATDATDTAADGEVAPEYALGTFFFADVRASHRGPSLSGVGSTNDTGVASLTVYRLADHGRVTQASLMYSSDIRRSLRALDADVRPRAAPALPGTAWAGGDALGGALPPFSEPGASHRKFLQRVAQENSAMADPAAEHGLGSEIGLDPQLDTVSGIAAAAPSESSDAGQESGLNEWRRRKLVREQGSLTIQRTVTVANPSGSTVQLRETLLPARAWPYPRGADGII